MKSLSRNTILEMAKTYDRLYNPKTRQPKIPKATNKQTLYNYVARGGSGGGPGCLSGDKRGWISNVDIGIVMDNYQTKYPRFRYLGTFLIDFANHFPDMMKLNLDKESHDTFGMIINTAKSGKPGKHWFALFIDKADSSICVYDSNGDKPNVQIRRFIDSIKQNSSRDWNVYINTVQRQKIDGTCGMFALNFIIEKLHGRSCMSLNNDSQLTDSKMNSLRCKLF